jgi:hypothetical protein
MSKLLNLTAYALACLLTCINLALSCICERLAKHASQIIVAHIEMIFILFIYACLTCGDLAQIATSHILLSVCI